MDLKKKLLGFKGAYKDFPFGEDVAVFKVMKKMFALVSIYAEPLTISLKCDPYDAETLREMFVAVKPGYYLNKKHWNTITLDNTVPEEMIEEMIQNSYDLVVKGLTKAQRAELQNLKA